MRNRPKESTKPAEYELSGSNTLLRSFSANCAHAGFVRPAPRRFVFSTCPADDTNVMSSPAIGILSPGLTTVRTALPRDLRVGFVEALAARAIAFGCRAVIVEPLDRNAFCELWQPADVITVMMRQHKVVDLLHAGILQWPASADRCHALPDCQCRRAAFRRMVRQTGLPVRLRCRRSKSAAPLSAIVRRAAGPSAPRPKVIPEALVPSSPPQKENHSSLRPGVSASKSHS